MVKKHFQKEHLVQNLGRNKTMLKDNICKKYYLFIIKCEKGLSAYTNKVLRIIFVFC